MENPASIPLFPPLINRFGRPLREQLVHTFNLPPVAIESGGGPARYWCTQDGEGTIGFISPLSQHFCVSCNRVRLSVDGNLYRYLGHDDQFELHPLLRAGMSDAQREAAIRITIERKPEHHEFNENRQKIVRFMSQTGG